MENYWDAIIKEGFRRMKQLIFIQENPQMGKLKVVLRIVGRLLYFKFSDNQYSQGIISQLKAKGAEITIRKGWVQINIFQGQEVIKLGEKEIVIEETSDEEFEVLLSDFYKIQYVKAGFKLESEKDG